MKLQEIVIPKYSEYKDEKWNYDFLKIDVTLALTKRQIADLLTDKINYEVLWEEYYVKFRLWKSISSVNVNNILFNRKEEPKKPDPWDRYHDVYIDEWTKIKEIYRRMYDEKSWILKDIWWEGVLGSVMSPEINLPFNELVKIIQWNFLPEVSKCYLETDYWSKIEVDLTLAKLTN